MPQADASSIHSEPMIELMRELALDLGAVWNRYTDDIWRQIDPDVWLLTRNPWLMLHHASHKKLKSMADDQTCVVGSSNWFSRGGSHRTRPRGSRKLIQVRRWGASRISAWSSA
jgi:hypothetical protein